MTIAELIKSEKELHPKAKPIDFYKLVFQAKYGPAHILNNKEHSYRYLFQELKITPNTSTEIQDISLENNDFIRVGLANVKDADKFFGILIQSAYGIEEFSKSVWLECWNKIKNQLTDYGNFEAELNRIDDLLRQNKFIFHHSKDYTKYYQPHYRVVSKKLWESL